MQAVAAMGDHDSFADFGRAAKAAARSSRLQKLLMTLASSVLLWVAAYVKGWEASIVYSPRMKTVERRIGAIEDAGVDVAEMEALDTIQRAERDRLSQHIDAERALEVERWRAWLRLMVHPNRIESATRDYDADVAAGYAPHIAADRAARWSRPPGR